MKNINISISEGYSGQDALISYITKNKIISYCRFLKSYCNIIVASITNSSSTFSDNWNNLDNLWAGCFLCEGKDFPDLKDKELLRSIKRKKNLVSALASHSENVIEIPTNDHSISVKDDYCKITKKNASHSENVIETPTNDHSISVKDDYYKITKKNNIIDFCCDILQELDGNYIKFAKYKELFPNAISEEVNTAFRISNEHQDYVKIQQNGAEKSEDVRKQGDIEIQQNGAKKQGWKKQLK
ncbi:10838_t:CDS:2, partial [Rhizophagus irregularis]